MLLKIGQHRYSFWGVPQVLEKSVKFIHVYVFAFKFLALSIYFVKQEDGRFNLRVSFC